MKSAYDCVVIGGGPAGSTAAALVAEQGFSTLLVEREQVPRFHVGESLMPETYWTLSRLGVLDRLRSAGFSEKHGVQFVSRGSNESRPFYFNEHDPRECARTWHVERAKFDQILFENAGDKGAHIYDRTRVASINKTDSRVSGVRIQTVDDTEHDVDAQVVIDASGQRALLASSLGLKDNNPDLQNAAIWTYYEGAQRVDANGRSVTVILHTTDKRCWFWYIPLSENRVSVGLVSENDYLLRDRGTPAEVFEEELSKCDGVARRIASARQCDRFHVAKEFSYTTREHAGDGWVLVGDAAGFIDPVYSTGVFLALKSGEMAADCVVDGLSRNDLSAASLGKWTSEYDAGVALFRRLVGAYYSKDFSFADFMRAHPDQQGNLSDLLIGRVFDGSVGEIFEKMDASFRKDLPC